MMIDIFAHILPIKYDENLKKKGEPGFYQEEVITILPTLTDLDIRFRIMDKYEDYLQVLTIASPPVENVVGPKDAVELAKIANDEMAELVSKYPDRFVSAVGCLPLNDIDASLKEIDRVINDLKFSGIQVFTDINGKPIDSPEFMPLYEKMQYYDLPIWLHPRRERIVPDYPTENSSKYAVYVMLGWPYETTVAMARLVFSGVFEKYPNLKIVTHHCGGMVPYFEQRIAAHRDFSINRVRRAQWPHLTKRPLDYFRMYYNDTAIWSTPALMCAYAFCGAEHMLFGTDMPYDSQIGHRSVRDTIRSINEMGIPGSDKEKIFSNNARKLMRLTV